MPTPAPFPDLLAAIVAWFQGDATLTALFPGGLVTSRGAVGQELPYARASFRKPQPGLTLEDEHYIIKLGAYAATEDAAKDAADTLLLEYLSTTRAPLQFTDKAGQTWTEAMRKDQEGEGPDQVDFRAGVDDQDPTPVWRYQYPLEVWVVPAP